MIMFSSNERKCKFSNMLIKVFPLSVILLLTTFLAVFYSFSSAFSEIPNSNETVAVNTTTGKGYETLDAAVLEAKDSEVVEIQKEDTYVVDCFRTNFSVPHHITISANESLDPDKVILDGVCYDEE